LNKSGLRKTRSYRSESDHFERGERECEEWKQEEEEEEFSVKKLYEERERVK
jgi:hypothetical protein